jgi:aminoglycoside phosphotransferase family enzyme
MPDLPPLVQALLDPKIYPHDPQKVELVQTQMSFLFLTGDYAYKVKKPIDLGYLDYTTLEKRRFFCHRELKLNRRLSPDIYLEVLPIVQHHDKIILGNEGEAIEYTVKMVQLPPDCMMNVLLDNNQVSEGMVRQVAQKLVDFHEQAETNAEISKYGSLETILINTEENFTQTEKYIGISISSEQHRGIKDYTDTFAQGNATLFEKRMKDGRIRDCHGDLHTAHICFINGICIYDCIEFNDRFRYCDVTSEIAFLAMDLDCHHRPDLARQFIDAYVESSKDEEILKLLNFYKCYRAQVRGKVEGFKINDALIPEEEKTRALAAARRYFELAESYIGSV